MCPIFNKFKQYTSIIDNFEIIKSLYIPSPLIEFYAINKNRKHSLKVTVNLSEGWIILHTYYFKF